MPKKAAAAVALCAKYLLQLNSGKHRIQIGVPAQQRQIMTLQLILQK